MGLKIIGSADGEAVAAQMREAIEGAIESAQVEVTPASAGHFTIRVVASAFEGRNPLQRQQRVYAAIAHLMAGEAPPVHAIDRMETVTP
jgi:acid stress-induced BolA-like protein IbaG/YrbA